jgi:hypothetical protein
VGDLAARSATAGLFAFAQVEDIYAVSFAWEYFVATTHSGTQYWTAKISDSDGGNATTLTSDKATTAAFVQPAATAIGAVISAPKALEINLTKVSTPGTIISMYQFRYRRIVT